MPYKDKADEKAWRKRSYTKAYMRWLYARRKLQVEKVKVYEETLLRIGNGGVHSIEVARDALVYADDLAREVGNRFDHENDKPYYKEG